MIWNRLYLLYIKLKTKFTELVRLFRIFHFMPYYLYLHGIHHRKESTEFLKNLLRNQKVRLEYDVGEEDRFGRTLAYVVALRKRQ